MFRIIIFFILFSGISYAAYLPPGGNNNDVQFKNAASFAGSDNFVFNGANVGIGSTHPGQALDVQGTVRMTGLVLIGNGASSSNVLVTNSVGIGSWLPVSAIVSSTQWTTTNTNDVYLPNSGNVGIGTTTTNGGAALTVMNGNVGIGTWAPSYLLSVGQTSNPAASVTADTMALNGGTNGTSTDYLSLFNQNGTRVMEIESYSNSSPYQTFFTQDGFSNNQEGIIFALSSSNNVPAVIEGGESKGSVIEPITFGSTTAVTTIAGSSTYMNGNVGIGTVTPVSSLAVVGNIGIGTIGYDSYVTTTPSKGGMVISGNVGLGTWLPSQQLEIGKQKVDITSGGNVGIGTILPTGALEIEGGNVGIGTALTQTAAFIVMSGNVGIGTWNPRASLDLTKETDALILPSGTASQEPGTAVNGMIRYNSTVPWIETYQNSGWKPTNGIVTICSSGTASGTTSSSSETNLAVCTIPAGAMGTNGSLFINVLYKYVGTNGTKTPALRFSSTSGDTSGGTLFIGGAATTSNLALESFFVQMVYNANSASSQIAAIEPNASSGGADAWGPSTSAPVTSVINTANVSYLNFNCATTSASDTCAIAFYSVILYQAM